ncbi:unconventional prefoldin RPB5 interactor 1-like [Gigantopelta aegis]|uniref:unconventional prefoldin RPB5 interactor 1-like n=1 Tax=Gigantopelta aegis TaxID=1735272 RepID=UPI001B88E4FF|nr:unconventional prefoldin RPB5 interactor 1-like [Gigantopelta aegis]XP_041376988.1 unconventional prefoldin RPB5 interactor 1-like [Gigantopelta aegis]XP_041376989.1 unconventional prefoldin RPB5 interactor 1-like [Gigantopelta aegis]
MNKDHIARLREEQDKAIRETDEKIQQWEKFKSDYEAVAKKLSTLPDTISKDTLVQFGPLAFMPGQLVHTNEVLVLLGDNWFVERSAKQAIDIIERRNKEIDRQLKDLHEQKKLLMPRMAFTSELQDMAEERGGLKEIVEEYDEEKEKKWKEEHRVRVREYKKRSREESQKVESDSVTSKPDKPTDEELWVRLDRLEKIESEQRELERLCDSDDPEFTVDVHDSKKITWSDQTEGRVHKTSVRDSDDSSGSSGDSEQSSSDGYTSDEEESASDDTRNIKITFTHSTTSQQEDQSPGSDGDKPKISSPRDIYSLFTAPTELKSILKNKSRTSSTTSAEESAHNQTPTQNQTPNISSDTPKPFSGIVVENPTSVVSSAASSASSSVATDTQPTRRVSKFRAERQKQVNPR